MKETYSIFLIFILGLLSRQTSGQDRTDSLLITNDIKLSSIDFNVIKFDAAYHYIFPKTFKSTDLKEEEVILIEFLLRKMIVQYNIDAKKKFVMMDTKFPKYGLKLKDFTIELDGYGRQYMPVISDEGKKIVYVGCFCDPENLEYRTKELVEIMDGGNCYFQFKVDLETRQIFDFSENGVG